MWLSTPSAFDSLDSEVSLSSFLFLDMDDFNLLTTHFLISSLDSLVFSSFGILFRGEAEPVLLLGLMKFLRSSFLPSFFILTIHGGFQLVDLIIA